jgi:hypothetical protein
MEAMAVMAVTLEILSIVLIQMVEQTFMLKELLDPLSQEILLVAFMLMVFGYALTFV